MRQYELRRDESGTEADDGRAREVLQGLNEAQRTAVQATDGPVMIIAGPGSGKTRTLTHRIAYLIARGKAQPRDVMALTFTNKAAREMKQRVQQIIGSGSARGMWMGTFHSTFARLLRREGEHIGYTSDFSIYDTDDTDRLLRNLMKGMNIDPKQFKVRTMRSLISSAKNQLVSPEDYQRMATGAAQERAAQLYGPYVQTLRRANALDFDDLLIKPIELFETHPDILEQYQRRWRYLHIDEYQDTNHAQYKLAKLLAARHKNICVVGDDAQSIYAFRGADIGNILSFQRDYPDATVVRLEQNYRSTKTILQLADSIIKQNEDQLEKELWTDNHEGEYVVLIEALSERDEAKKIEQTVRDLHVREGYSYDDFAILYRTNAQSRSLEEALRRGGIPYRVIGGVSFYQRKEIKDVLAYLRLLVNPADQASLRRVINYPTRGIGAKTQERLFQYARREGLSAWQAIQQIDEAGLSTRAQNAIERFGFLISSHAAKAESMPADELARALIKETGMLDELRNENTRESLGRWENVQELISAIAEFTAQAEEATLATFLQEVALLTDLDEDEGQGNRVTLMTLHASKGLEFPVVFVSGLEEGLFPLSRAAQEREQLEEERRLFYVGATRAEQKLFLSYARSRFLYGKQESAVRSRFLDEIDPAVVRTKAGGPIKRQKDRFTLDEGDAVDYDEVDPHYYRRNLRGSKNTSSKRTRKTTRRASNGSSSGRRVVYDEGAAEIVPGVRVEHDHFGEGKVQALDGEGEQMAATVFFQSVGQKKLKLKYAKLRRIG